MSFTKTTRNPSMRSSGSMRSSSLLKEAPNSSQLAGQPTTVATTSSDLTPLQRAKKTFIQTSDTAVASLFTEIDRFDTVLSEREAVNALAVKQLKEETLRFDVAQRRLDDETTKFQSERIKLLQQVEKESASVAEDLLAVEKEKQDWVEEKKKLNEKIRQLKATLRFEQERLEKERAADPTGNARRAAKSAQLAQIREAKLFNNRMVVDGEGNVLGGDPWRRWEKRGFKVVGDVFKPDCTVDWERLAKAFPGPETKEMQTQLKQICKALPKEWRDVLLNSS